MGKSPIDSADTPGVDEIALSRTVSEINMFYTAETQDGCQKWQEIDFWEKSPVDSADSLQVKNFDEINLSHTVFEINVFYTENQDGHQKWPETDL